MAFSEGNLKRNGEMRSPVFKKFLYKTCHTSTCLPALCYTFQSYTFYWISLKADLQGSTKAWVGKGRAVLPYEKACVILELLNMYQQRLSAVIASRTTFDSRATVSYKKALVLSDRSSAGILPCMHGQCYTAISRPCNGLQPFNKLGNSNVNHCIPEMSAINMDHFSRLSV
jgi:hypothetical protein